MLLNTVMSHFHSGEVAVQQRMGQAHIADRVGRMIRADIPDIAAGFLAEQPMVVIAAADLDGRMWAGAVVGSPGFVHVVDVETIAIDAFPAAGDPLHEALARPARIGMIALKHERRRRRRGKGGEEKEEEGRRRKGEKGEEK